MSVRLSTPLLLVFLTLPLLIFAQPTLTIAAASDLTALEPSLQAAFHKLEPALEVRFVNGASSLLSQQIQNGAPFDVFLSANAAFIDKLASNGKILSESVVTYATGRLGVLWRDQKGHPLNDLAQNWVRFVALPNPRLAPYGVAAQQALEHAQLWSRLKPKIVYGENVSQTLQLFDSGNADAVITSGSLLKGRHPDVIPDSWYQPVVQKGGIVATTSHREAATTFLKFLESPSGRAVFDSYGYASPAK
jgi:molybdate transport system substrate-binding protein